MRKIAFPERKFIAILTKINQKTLTAITELAAEGLNGHPRAANAEKKSIDLLNY